MLSSRGGLLVLPNLASYKRRDGMMTSQKILVCGIFSFFLTQVSDSQWTSTSGASGSVRCMCIKGSDIFAGTAGDGAFRSTDNGAHWVRADSGLMYPFVYSLAYSDSFLFAGTNAGVYRSENSGLRWTIPGGALNDSVIASLVVFNAIIIAGAFPGAFRSTNYAMSWMNFGGPLNNKIVLSLSASGGVALAGTLTDGIYRLSPSGTSWIHADSGLSGSAVNSIAGSGTTFLAGTSSGIFRTTDSARSWVASGLTGLIVQSLVLDGTLALGGTFGDGVWLSTNGGTIWAPINEGLPDSGVYSLGISGDMILAGTATSGIWKRPLSEVIAPQVVPILASPDDSSIILRNSAFLKWRRVPFSTSYQVQFSSLLDSLANAQVVETSDTMFQLTDSFSYGTRYFWRVRGKNFVAPGPFSDTWTFATLIAVPVLIEPGANGVNVSLPVSFTWQHPGGNPTKYRLQVSTSPGFSTPVFDDSLTTNSVQIPLSTRSTYYWRVRAKNIFGWGEWSDSTRRFSTIPDLPGASQLISPQDTALNVPNPVSFSWRVDTGATNYHLLVFDSLQDTIVNDSSLQTNASSGHFLQNAHTYYWRVRARNAAGLGPFSSTWQFATSQGQAVPTLISPADGIAAVTVPAVLSWNQSAGATLYHIQIGLDATFTYLAINDSIVSGTTYNAASLAFNNRYYWHVAGIGGGGTSAWSSVFSFSTVSTTNVVSPQLSFSPNPSSNTEYRLVSLPGVSPATVSDFIVGAGERQQYDWRVFRDNGSASGNYLDELGSSDPVRPGEGYWLIRRNNVVISRTNATMPALRTDGTYPVVLQAGYNIIANPFEKPVGWSDVLRANGLTAPARVRTYADGRYDSSDVLLMPFKGYYFVRPAGADTLRIPYPFGPQNAHPTEAAPIEWRVQILLQSDINSDGLNFIGISPAARVDQDDLDEYKPPLVFDQGFLYFSRPEWHGVVDNFSSDFRPEVGEGQSWSLEVRNPRKSPSVIRLAGIEEIPSEYDVALIDLQHGTSIDLRRTREYGFRPATVQSHFKIVVGPEAFVAKEAAGSLPKAFALDQNYPNPFNPVTTISYAVPEESFVTLDVYTVLGELVSELVHGHTSPGYKAVEFDAHGIASGVYFYRLVARSPAGSHLFTRTKKLVLLR